MTSTSDTIHAARPVRSSERHAILDILRGLALLGIALANFSEFSLYSFLPADAAGALPTAGIDRIVRYLQLVFIDGKFYTLFSLLFGIGFSILIDHAEQRGASGLGIFYRRMAVLLLIGFLHLMLLWSGDILMLYACLGLLLPLFRRTSNRVLLTWAFAFLLLPVVVDFIVAWLGLDPSAPVVALQQARCAEYGITEENFAYWLRDAEYYGEVSEFLMQGAWVRLQEFIDGNRYFKVLGLFLLGFHIGRNRLYADLAGHERLFERMTRYGFLFGLPLSLLYAWSAVNGRPWGAGLHAVLYLVSVFPLGFAYAAGVSLCYLRHPQWKVFRIFVLPGRMALTNYIGQSAFGMLLFYGTGLGLGAGMGLVCVELMAAGVWFLQALFSGLWLYYCQFGPLEWIWRMLTYGKMLGLVKKRYRK